jgi:uncharacterized membrane protein
MQNLKNTGIALLLIIILAAIGIYFMPNHYSISNSIVINKPISEVYAQLSDFNKWAQWDPWKEKEPEASRSVEGPANTKGHKMSWEGKKIGTGSLTLNWSSQNKSINNDLAIVKPYPFSGKDIWSLEADGDKTKVTWTNSGGLSYPMGRVSGSMVDKVINEQQKHGLDNLKKYCELLPAAVASNDTATNGDKPM